MVAYTTTKAEFDTLMELSKSKLVVIDFTATWCGPCKMIGPHFEKLAEDYPELEFVKVDVDDASEVSELCGIQAMPTFQFYKNGNKVDELKGASIEQLKALVVKNK